jgi:hypothetical protein
MDILMEGGGERSESILSFCGLIRDLEAITFRRLSTTVEEEVAEREKLKDLRDKEKSYDKERIELQVRAKGACHPKFPARPFSI